ncbi:hypothetical protein [Siansivirga zeaxanthinifaciens]|uniref:hypothetical protein n=1 Tax=Siansivirga zeaxanthinifaciens TaxID=762954 RepID=UPI00268DCABA|nr:hypothetical protein [Siansivirga zeaxanthinifaciens]
MNKWIKNIFITFLIGCSIFLLDFLLNKGYKFDTLEQILIDFAFYQLYSFVLGYSNMFYFDFLERRSWSQKSGLKRIIIGILGSVIITLVGLFVLRSGTAVFYKGYTFQFFIAN